MRSRVRVSAVIFAAMAVIAPVYGQTTETAAEMTARELASVANPDRPQGEISEQQLAGALTELEGYDFGKERGFLLVIDAAIRQSNGNDAKRTGLATALTDRAVNDKLSYAARDLALRRLGEIGSDPQVDRLEKLLTDPNQRIAEMSRLYIANIPGDHTDKALLKALAGSTGKVREGIIDSLGQRRVKDAVAPLKDLARQDSSTEAHAAILALGKIGSEEAGNALLNDIRPPDAVREAWFMAMNDAGAALAGTNAKLAAQLYEKVQQMGGKSPARLAAFKGQALLEQHPEAVALKALDEGDAEVGEVARELLVRGNDPTITSQLVSRLATAAPDKKVIVVEILGARGDKAALAQISQLAEKSTADNADLQVAAISALRYLGDQQSVPLLVRVAAEGKGAVADAAKNVLTQMPVPEVDTELLRLVEQAANPAEKVAVIEAVAQRKPAGAMEQLNKAALNDNPKIATAAFKAISELGTDADLQAVLQTLGQVHDEKVLKEGARTVSAVAKNVKKPADAVNAVEAAYGAATGNDVKAALLPVLAKLGGGKALATIRQNLASPDEKLQDAAVRALADFPDASAIDDLMKIAAEGKSDVHKVLAQRAVARLLAAPSAKPVAERLAMAKRALDLATGPEEKKAVIGALADVKIPGVLAIIIPFIDQPEYKNESAEATVKQAPVANLFNPKETATLLNSVKGKVTPEQWAKLEAVLTTQASEQKAIRAFQASKIYKLDAKTSSGALLEHPFEPETGGGDWPQAVYAEIDEKDNAGKADLTTFYTETKSVAVYLRARIWSPDARKAHLETGSDDGMRAWVNDKQVLTHDNVRSFSWAEDKTPIDLKQGWNTVLLKVGQGSKDWAVAARVVDESGKPFTDLKYSALPQGE